MEALSHVFKQTALVFSLMLTSIAPAHSEGIEVDQLLRDLANPETENWRQIERKLRNEWSKSGSAAMDLLLQRGEKALEAKDFDKAIEHLTALTDHAPEFAEGWNARATAYFHKKLYGPAMEDIGRALALNPNHFGALTGLAVMLQDVGMTDQALDAWQMLREIHPHREEMDQAIEALDRLNGAQDI